METEAEKEAIDLELPLSEANPQRLVEYNALALSCVSSPRELEILVDALLQPEVVEFIDKQPKEFSVMASLWAETTRRVVYESPASYFPLQLLALIPLFHRYGWLAESTQTWEAVRDSAWQAAADTGPGEADFWTHQGRLLFLDGLLEGTEEAWSRLNDRLREQECSGELCSQALKFGTILGYCGW